MSIKKFSREDVYALIIIVSLFLAMIGGLLFYQYFLYVEPVSVDCESHPDFYLVNDYFDEEGFVYADIDDMTRIKYVGGGVFVGAE